MLHKMLMDAFVPTFVTGHGRHSEPVSPVRLVYSELRYTKLAFAVGTTCEGS